MTGKADVFIDANQKPRVPAAASASSPGMSEATRHAIASQAGGALSTLALYPLDVVKTRYMAQDSTGVRDHHGQRYRRLVDAVRSIRDQEGFRAFGRGAALAVAGSSMSWGAYMYVYRRLDAALAAAASTDAGSSGSAQTGVKSSSPPPSVVLGGSINRGLVAGAGAGAIVNVAMNPVWLVKTRLQLHRPAAGQGVSVLQGNVAVTAVGVVRDAIARDGVASLWRGTGAQLLTGVPASLQYPVYEAARRFYHATSDNASSRLWGPPSVAEVATCNLASKAFVTVTTHPLQLLRTRLMDTRSRDGVRQYVGLLQSVRMVLAAEGVAGIYRGVGVNFLHTAPRSMLQFQLYELVLTVGGLR